MNNPPKVFNAINSYPGDNHYYHEHVANLDGLGHPMLHCLYNAMEGDPSIAPVNYTVQCHEGFDDLSVMLYGMCKHALMIHDWDYFLKTDINILVSEINWGMVFGGEYSGMVAYGKPGNSTPPEKKLRQMILKERCTNEKGRIAWCGGPAYCISRRVVQAIADRGVWAARGQWAEDVYVGIVTAEMGISPNPAIKYFERR